MIKKNSLVLTLSFSILLLNAQNDPKTTELWEPVPPKVIPGENGTPPSDAIILFDGNDSSKFESVNGGEVKWKVENGYMTVVPGTGSIKTKQGFGDCQLHIEWRTPEFDDDEGQGKGNSGIMLMGKYELQVLDSYENKTYANGQAASIYKQHIPLVNACKNSGEWQIYDIIFTAPKFGREGRMISPARITVLHNGVLVQNNVSLLGTTKYIGLPVYKEHGDKEPLILQNHTDLVSYRNIWIREL
jgi:hypothetical protein